MTIDDLAKISDPHQNMEVLLGGLGGKKYTKYST
jgi:hypothetical protein